MLRPRVHITYDVLRTLHADVPTFSTHHSPLIAHRSKAQRHEFNPNVVAMAERILITVWMISFQVSLFFILINGLRTPSKSPPRGRLITRGRVEDFVKI